MPAGETQTTVPVAAELLEEMDALVRQGEADSRDDRLEKAPRNQLAAPRRAAIDAEFAQMATDQTNREEAVRVIAAFAQADWEALEVAEKYL